jgi:hypothetical protein
MESPKPSRSLIADVIITTKAAMEQNRDANALPKGEKNASTESPDPSDGPVNQARDDENSGAFGEYLVSPRHAAISQGTFQMGSEWFSI